MTRPRCPSTSAGNRCTRPAGHRDRHTALHPSAGWLESCARDDAAKVQEVAGYWEWWAFEETTLHHTLRGAAVRILLLAADAGLDADGLRELARRLRP